MRPAKTRKMRLRAMQLSIPAWFVLVLTSPATHAATAEELLNTAAHKGIAFAQSNCDVD